ncbi:putative rRNA methylase protein [Corchorus olitorius]|uniref:rRNA methylase protein n=1 Tax=Corchorus olitorius TaxID=93759 RepID=A0A1R3H004_9ROSI|nr:putative rRNA methylase protein [Corchorus olitorius]
MSAALRCCPRLFPSPLLSNKILPQTYLFSFSSSFFSSPKNTSKNLCYSSNSILLSNGGDPSPNLLPHSPLSGLENELVGYIFGKKKATEVAHLVWRHVLHKGDIVIDATCGNGYDTLAMLKMVADESGRGGVYAMDIQTEALESTSSLLDATVTPKEKEVVKLFPLCHSRMEEVVPENTAVRLVAFNLGYLPGGDKGIITISKTTLLALEASINLLISGGLISLVVYVGHPGGSWNSDAHFGE